MPAWSEGHPLSEAANHLIASMVRKVGGFTFQELNLTIDDIRITSESGADLSYDFINRPAYHHALATQSTEFLRLTLNASRAHGVDPMRLVHALQNHDELTYELVHFATTHKDDEFEYLGDTITGAELSERIRGDLIDKLTGPAAPYNRIFTTNGIASTTASVIAGALGITDLDTIDDETVEDIRRAHLLLAMFNALQPGVFALSGWDLCGTLPLPADRVAHLTAGGDTRWIHRAAYDLMGYDNPDFTGMPSGTSLYGSLPSQLDDPNSFVSRLRRIIEIREKSGLATATQLDTPAVSHPGMLVMVHLLPDNVRRQITVLNFSQDDVHATVQSEHLSPGASLTDMFTDSDHGTVDTLNSFDVALGPHDGISLLMQPQNDEAPLN
jgi:trehalose synthase